MQFTLGQIKDVLRRVRVQQLRVPRNLRASKCHFSKMSGTNYLEAISDVYWYSYAIPDPSKMALTMDGNRPQPRAKESSLTSHQPVLLSLTHSDKVFQCRGRAKRLHKRLPMQCDDEIGIFLVCVWYPLWSTLQVRVQGSKKSFDSTVYFLCDGIGNLVQYWLGYCSFALRNLGSFVRYPSLRFLLRMYFDMHFNDFQ